MLIKYSTVCIWNVSQIVPNFSYDWHHISSSGSCKPDIEQKVSESLNKSLTAVIRTINGSCRSSNLPHSSSLLPASFNHTSFILNIAVYADDTRTSILLFLRVLLWFLQRRVSSGWVFVILLSFISLKLRQFLEISNRLPCGHNCGLKLTIYNITRFVNLRRKQHGLSPIYCISSAQPAGRTLNQLLYLRHHLFVIYLSLIAS